MASVSSSSSPISDATSNSSATQTSSPFPTSESIKEGVRDTSRKAHDSVEALSNAARPAIDRAAERAHAAVDYAAAATVDAVDQFSNRTARLRAAPARLAESATEQIRGNPWRALGLALAVGFVLGRLTSD